ncbi:MAG: carbamoyl phosphate synthase small subunit [Thiotrichales bacterium]|nr:MAG: carbamoyl phosphate synthase small subunit [Thiotrichales bacterium]
MQPYKLVLSTGKSFSGLSPDWLQDDIYGEVVFTTGMVGYTETLTDPSYKNQIVVFTYPLIGNYGVENEQFWESGKIHAKGVVINNLEEHYSRNDRVSSFADWCKNQGVALITDIDTRAVTKTIRSSGALAGAICSQSSNPVAFANINQENLVAQVSRQQTEIINKENAKHSVIVVDCGMKQNILRLLKQLPVNLKVVPYDYDYSNEDFSGIFLSNGPGDPLKCQDTIEILKRSFGKKKPVFGICLGAQLMALATGAKTKKLHFGHRSQNQPCMHVESKKCYLTSQNHGYVICEDTLPDDWRISWRNLNDATVEGIEHKIDPFFAVQFHPEATPGPNDTTWMFQHFYELIQKHN